METATVTVKPTTEKKLFMDGSKLSYHPDAVRKWRDGDQIYPIHIEISPTAACNQRCIHCCVDFLGHKTIPMSGEMMMRLPSEFEECGVKSYLLAGEGEPLWNKYTVPLVEKMHSRGINGSLTTNGVLFRPAVAERILPAIDWMRFSVQSFDPANYTILHAVEKGAAHLKVVIKHIKEAVRIKREQGLKTTLGVQQILLNENSGDDIVNSARMSKELGVDYFTIKRFSQHPDNSYHVPEDLPNQCMDQFDEADALTDDNFKVYIRRNQFFDQNRGYDRCSGGLAFIAQLLAKGDIWPRIQFYGKEGKQYGNLENATLKEIFDSDHAKELREDIEKNYEVNGGKNNPPCMSYCRHHSTNLHLEGVRDGTIPVTDDFGLPPKHVNFI